MWDLIVVASIVGALVLSLGFIALCDRL